VNIKYGILAAVVIFACLLMTVGSMPVRAADEVVISISPPEQTLNAGQTVTLDILIDTGSTEIRGWQGGVFFDADMLECTNVTEGGFLKTFGSTASPFDSPEIDNVNGQVNMFCYVAASEVAGGVSGSGVLCTLSFMVKPEAEGPTDISPIDFIVADAADLEIEDVTLNSGTVNINPIFPGVTLGISSSVSSVYTGGTFDLTVRVNTDDLNSLGAGLSLTYNPAMVSCISMEEGSFYKTDEVETSVSPKEVIDNTAGKVEYFQINVVDASTGGQIGSGVVCLFHMQAKYSSGTAAISMGDGAVLDGDGNNFAGITVNPASVAITVKQQSSGGGGGGGGGGVKKTTPPVTTKPAATTPPATTLSPTPEPSTVVSPTPSISITPDTTPSPVTTSATPEITVTKPAVTAPSNTIAAVPSTTPVITPGLEVFNGTAVFDLKELLDSNGKLISDYDVEKSISKDGTIDLGLEIKSGTAALTRQLKALESITVTAIESSASIKQKIDPVIIFECSPSPSTFSPPLVLTIRYDPAALPEKTKESDLKLAVYDSKNVEWVVLESKVDIVNHTVSAEVDHFSTFALIEKSGGSFPWIIIVVVGVVVVLAVLAFFIFVRRKKTAS
jgi:hypothetical protein